MPDIMSQDWQVVDLTHPLEEQMPVWPLLPRFFHNRWTSIEREGFTAYQLVLGEHIGTHLDAPGHYLGVDHPAHAWIEDVPLRSCMGPAVVIRCDGTPLHGTGPEVVTDWEATQGRLSRGDIVLFDFGWAERWTCPPTEPGLLHDWPGLTVPCAELLVDRGVVAVGSDTISPDIFGAPGDPVHHVLLGHGVVIYEGLARLGQLPPRCYFMGLPLPIRHGSGSPVRAVALIPASGGL